MILRYSILSSQFQCCFDTKIIPLKIAIWNFTSVSTIFEISGSNLQREKIQKIPCWQSRERTSYKQLWISGVCSNYLVHFLRALRKKWDYRQEPDSESLANQQGKRGNAVCRGPCCNSVHHNWSYWQILQTSPQWKGKARPYRYLLARCNLNQIAQTGTPHWFLMQHKLSHTMPALSPH